MPDNFNISSTMHHNINSSEVLSDLIKQISNLSVSCSDNRAHQHNQARHNTAKIVMIMLAF